MGRVGRLLRRDWPRTQAHSMHDLRTCPDCFMLLDRWCIRPHEMWHRDLEERFGVEMDGDYPGGYVVGTQGIPETGPVFHTFPSTRNEQIE
jgi:hypothetical protein